MPNFFGRRYMRGQPRRTERLVGAFVLALLALIVGLFALTGGLFANVVNGHPSLARLKDAIGISETPLFVADPKNAKPAAPPHEMREGMALLPMPNNAAWVRDGLLTASIGGANPDTFSFRPFADERAKLLLKLAEEFGGTSVYAGSYRPSSLKPGLAGAMVYLIDCGSPEAAFGLWHAARMDGSKDLPIGRGGWSNERGGWSPGALEGPSVSFWAGRFVSFVFSDSKQSQLDPIVRLLSSVQINYGGPFWAESVLPREGQRERTFRYVKKDPLSVDTLSDCWLADYQNGVTIGVMRPNAPDKIFAALKQRAATQPAGAPVLDKEALAASAVSLQVGEKLLTAFDAGPYVFVITAPPEQIQAVASTAKMLHDHWSGVDVLEHANASSTGANPQSAFRNPQSPSAAGQARFAEVDGLDAPAKTERFTDNLYEKVDGREPVFRSFGFVELRFGQYLDGRSKQSFDVYLYDMGEPNNALGIYGKERSAAQASAGVGRDSYVSGTNVYFWKGKYYVNILSPADGGEAVVASAKKIAAAIDVTIADTGSGFWAEDVLPKEDRVPDSFKYSATGAMSYDFFKRVYRAEYKVGDKTFGLFAKKAANPQAAHDLFVKLADAAKKYGDVIEQRVDTAGSELLLSRSVDVYTVVFAKGVFVGGVADCDDKELAIKKGQLLRDRMPANAAGEPEPASEPAKSGTQGGDDNGH